MRNKPPFLLMGLFFMALTVMLWWGFAFLPLPDVAPEWVNRARTVCFALADNGLPQHYGWMLLIGTPLMMLAALVIGWGEDWQNTKNFIGQHKAVLRLIFLVAILLMIESHLIGKKITAALRFHPTNNFMNESRENLANYPRLKQTPPELNLYDETGKKITLAMARGKVLFLTFAFAHCKAICPMLAENLKKVHEAIGSDKSTVYIISLDPWRDTVGSLSDMHTAWHLPPTMHVLSGTPEEVNKVLDAFKVPRARDDKTGEVVHPALVDVINPEGELSYIFNGASSSLLTQAGKGLMNGFVK